MAIGNSTLSYVVGIRDKIARGTKLEKYEQTFRRENPEYFSWKQDRDEAEDVLNWVRSQWNEEEG